MFTKCIVVAQERRLCSAGAAERSYPMSNVSSGSCEELPQVQGQQWRQTGATLPTSKVSSSGGQELPHVQGQEQRP